MKNKKSMIYYVAPFCSILLLILGWLYMSSVKPELFPTPTAAWNRFILLLERPLARVPLWRHVINSLCRVMIALAVASVTGVVFGIFMGWNKTFNATFGSLFQIIRPIPPIAWIPLITIWFGIGEFSKILIIFIGTFSIVVTNTYAGVSMVDPLNLAVGRVFHASEKEILMEIVLPAALPAIFSGIRMAIGVGWAVVLAAEMVGAASGVGFLISRGNELRDMALIFVCMFIIGIIGALISVAASWLERRLCPWKN